MPRTPGSFSLTVRPWACVLAALWLLVLPLRWCLAAVTAAVIHESFHCLAVYLCGGRILRGEIGGSGALLETTPIGRGRELLCTLAGPLGGIVTMVLFHRFPRLVLCAGLQTAWNLLPLMPLDGGRALDAAAHMLLPPRAADGLCRGVDILVTFGMAALGLYGTVMAKLGLLPILLAGALLLRTGKIACKSGGSTVQ